MIFNSNREVNMSSKTDLLMGKLTKNLLKMMSYNLP
jgi:hypothetical protein